MTIDEIKTEVRKIEKYYDYNHQTNDYDVLVNLTEITNLILLQNKISYNKAIDDFVNTVIEHQYLLSDKINSTDYGMFTCGINEIAQQLKVGGENE